MAPELLLVNKIDVSWRPGTSQAAATFSAVFRSIDALRRMAGSWLCPPTFTAVDGW